MDEPATDEKVHPGDALRVRDGALGAWDRLIGPGASSAETTAILATAIGGGIATAVLARRTPRWGRVAATALGFDLWGGVVANSMPTCVRWYERPGQGTREHVVFAAGHVHPFVIALLDRRARAEDGSPDGWRWAAGQYLWMLGSTAAVVTAPRRLRRRLGLAATAVGIALDRLAGPSPNAPWFAPVYHGKLLAGHAGAGAFPLAGGE